MEYSLWGNKIGNPYVSRLGFGTYRLSGKNKDNDIAVVLSALDHGINYFDVAPTYANGYAEKILGEAFRISNFNKDKLAVAAKTGLSIDKTCDDVLRRIDNTLNNLGLDYVEFYNIWSLMDYEQYKSILDKKGLYDGLLRAKQEGLIKHIGISIHCDLNTVKKIIDDGLFEGITISMNAINYKKWIPYIQQAKARNIGIATMNSLGGGTIPKYSKVFESLDSSLDPVPVKALRLLRSYSEINVCLSGMENIEELKQNCLAFENEKKVFYSYDSFKLAIKEPLCSGCGYCSPCTVGIPISSLMQAYNHKILTESNSAHIDWSNAKEANQIFVRIRMNGCKDILNLDRCISCHACEKRCTQRIDITKRLQWIYKIQDRVSFNKASVMKRLEELKTVLRQYKSIAVWPTGMYANNIIELINDLELEKKFIYVNSSPNVYGGIFRTKDIFSPEIIKSSPPDAILILSYRFQNEIYNSLDWRWIEKNNISVYRLHGENDISWFDWVE